MPAPTHNVQDWPFSLCSLPRSASGWMGSSHMGPSQQKSGNGKLFILHQAA